MIYAYFLISAIIMIGRSSGFQHTNSVIKPSRNTRTLHMTDTADFTRWINPVYNKIDVDKWWNDLGDAEVTIGDKGIQPSHINTVLQFLYSHERIRLKFSSDRVNQMEVSQILQQDLKVSEIADVLDIRKRGIMIGRRKGVLSPNFVVAKKESHGLCLDFFSAGHTCKYGDGCKYSHDTKLTSSKKELLVSHLNSLKPKRVLKKDIVTEI